MHRRWGRRLLALCACCRQSDRLVDEIEVTDTKRFDASPTKSCAACQDVRQCPLPAGHSRDGLIAGLGCCDQLGEFLWQEWPVHAMPVDSRVELLQTEQQVRR